MRFLILLIIIIIPTHISAQRLLIGINQSGIEPRDKQSHSSSSTITQCEYGENCYSENKQYNNYQHLSFEFDPYYFLGGLGINFGLISPKEYKLRLLDFPNNDEYIDLKTSNTKIFSGLFYNIGDKKLGRDGNLSFRIGLILYISDRKAEYVYKGKNYSEKRTRLTNYGDFLNIDIGNFNFSLSRFYNDIIKLDDSIIKNGTYRGGDIHLDYHEYVFAYSYYFD